MREVREREVTGESESEGEGERERESDIFYLNDCGVQMTKLGKIETPCPEYPGQWPESPGVTRCHLDDVSNLSSTS